MAGELCEFHQHLPVKGTQKTLERKDKSHLRKRQWKNTDKRSIASMTNRASVNTMDQHIRQYNSIQFCQRWQLRKQLSSKIRPRAYTRSHTHVCGWFHMYSYIRVAKNDESGCQSTHIHTATIDSSFYFWQTRKSTDQWPPINRFLVVGRSGAWMPIVNASLLSLITRSNELVRLQLFRGRRVS